MKIYSILSTLLLAVYSFPDHAGQCPDDPTAMAKSPMGGQNDLTIGWSIQSSVTSYTPGTPVNITIQPKKQGATFMGLLLFAKAANNAHIGTWDNLPDKFQTLDDQCKQWGLAKSTLSHNSNEPKVAPISFTWTPPKKGLGKVEFRGIVVTKSKTNWMQFTPLSVDGPGNITDATNSNLGSTNSTATSLQAFGWASAGVLVASFF